MKKIDKISKSEWKKWKTFSRLLGHIWSSGGALYVVKSQQAKKREGPFFCPSISAFEGKGTGFQCPASGSQIPILS
jgi:hypothetical protein